MAFSATCTVVYALTSDGRDVYADINLLSLWSLKQSNPRLGVAILVDSVSAAQLFECEHPILSAGAEIHEVECPVATAGWRNRFLKTQVRKHFAGPLLYLDGDTLVRGDLLPVFQTRALVAGVPNHNGLGTASEIPAQEKNNLSLLGWNTGLPAYANGGVLFMADSPEVHAFSECWHERWLCSARTTGQHFDQPALNQAIYETGVPFAWLDHRYNAQVHARPSTARNAAVWHIYRSERHPNPPNRLDELIALQRAGVPEVFSRLAEACAQTHPWIAKNMFDRSTIRRMMSSDQILHGERWERLWLTHQYKRLFLKLPRKIRAGLSGAVKRLGAHDAHRSPK